MIPRRWRVKILFAATITLFVGSMVHYSSIVTTHSPHVTEYPNGLGLSASDSEEDLMRNRRVNLNLPDLDDPRRGCVMPKLTKYNPIYQKNGYKDKTGKSVICKKDPDWLIVEKGRIMFNQASVGKYGHIKCLINWMERVSDFKQRPKQPAITYDSNLNSTVMIDLEEDFFYADCKTVQSGVFAPTYRWSNVMSGIRPRKVVLQRVNEEVSMDGALETPLNVLVFGFDSVSHVNFMRRLPNLYNLLIHEMDGIVLDNYNIVGDGTTAAILGMLAGSYEEELPETRRGKSTRTCDVYPFVFKKFRSNRYVTAYAEDESSIGTFQYRLNGFKDPPSDHYMRPFHLQAELDHNKHPTYCLGSKPKINILMDWLEGILTGYPDDVGKFIFGFHSEYSHGVVEELNLADIPVTAWIRHLKESGLLDNTILMVMSDHGHRFSFTRSTLQGKYEERLPFFSVIVPEIFKTRFPNSYKALKINAIDRLTSPFDVHETFKSVLYDLNAGLDVGTEGHDGRNLTRGLTLFKEIPLERTCTSARISDHWCACNSWMSVDSNTDPLVMRGAEAIVAEINKIVRESGQDSSCQTLTVSKITRSQKMTPKKEMIAFKESKDHDGRVPDLSGKTEAPEVSYELQIVTNPGGGLYEGTTKYTQSSDTFEVNIKEVSRVNKYGLTSKCVADRFPHLAKFCYCRNQSGVQDKDAGYMGVIMG